MCEYNSLDLELPLLLICSPRGVTEQTELRLTVSIEVVEDGHAGLLLPALPHLLPVVWLRLAGTASVGPVSELERMT